MSTAEQRRQNLMALISASGVAVAKPPTLLPSSYYFDLAGEEFGRRLLLTTGVDGAPYCLRPDFTLPIAKSYIRANQGNPAALSYLGPVFRQRDQGPSEFEQAGLELLAQTDPDVALARVFDFVRQAFSIFEITNPSVRLGSIELFETLLAAVDMPQVWRPRLQRRFGNKQALNSLLERLADPHGDIDEENTGSRDELIATITRQMLEDGLSLVEGRPPEEIADRLLEKQALAAARVPPKSIDLLRAYLAMSGPVDETLQEVETLFASAAINLADSVEKVRTHAAAMAQILDGAKVGFDAGFSPRLHYYTGLVFEITALGDEILASGGQYDRLLQSLGADRQIPASGCALWVQRLQAEAEQKAKAAI